MSKVHFDQSQKSLNSACLKVTLFRSYAGCSETQRRTFRSLGLRKLGNSRVLPNVNPILGQINKVIQFVRVEPVE
jgi:large subunit ribosomal protein L30